MHAKPVDRARRIEPTIERAIEMETLNVPEGYVTVARLALCENSMVSGNMGRQ